MTSISLPSPGSPRSRFPCFDGTMEMCDSLRLSRRASLPSLGDTMRCVCRFAPVGPRRQTAGQGFVIRSPLPEIIAWKQFRASQVPGESSCAFALFSDPGRTDAAGHFAASTRSPCAERRRLHAIGNFGAEWHGFSTGCLRFVRWVAHTRTQDSLLVAGQALPGGIRTRRIPTKGFGNAQYITSPSPKLFLAQSASSLFCPEALEAHRWYDNLRPGARRHGSWGTLVSSR